MLATRDRCIDVIGTTGGTELGILNAVAGRNRGRVYHQHAVVQTGEQAIVTVEHVTNLIGAGHADQYRFSLSRNFRRRRDKHPAVCNYVITGLAPNIVNEECMARLLKVVRHGAAHSAKTDKADIHFGEFPNCIRFRAMIAEFNNGITEREIAGKLSVGKP